MKNGTVRRHTCLQLFVLFMKSNTLSPAPLQGSVDSNWVVGATLEKKLLPLPLSLVLCTFLNHRKNKFQCGFGITIG